MIFTHGILSGRRNFKRKNTTYESYKWKLKRNLSPYAKKRGKKIIFLQFSHSKGTASVIGFKACSRVIFIENFLERECEFFWERAGKLKKIKLLLKLFKLTRYLLNYQLKKYKYRNKNEQRINLNFNPLLYLYINPPHKPL